MQNKNSSTTQEIRDVARSQDAVEVLPSSFSPTIQLVAEVNPKMLRRSNVLRNSSAVNSTSSTVYTVPSEGEFYLTFAQIAIIKDATSTSTQSYIQCQPKGYAAQRILSIPSLTLTAQEAQVSATLAAPLLLEPGSTITLANQTNVANITAHCCIAGYYLKS